MNFMEQTRAIDRLFSLQIELASKESVEVRMEDCSRLEATE